MNSFIRCLTKSLTPATSCVGLKKIAITTTLLGAIQAKATYSIRVEVCSYAQKIHFTIVSRDFDRDIDREGYYTQGWYTTGPGTPCFQKRWVWKDYKHFLIHAKDNYGNVITPTIEGVKTYVCIEPLSEGIGALWNSVQSDRHKPSIRRKSNLISSG